MNATLLYRIAALVFFVGCIGHTHHVLSPPPAFAGSARGI